MSESIREATSREWLEAREGAEMKRLIEAIRGWNGDSPDMLKEAAVELVREHEAGLAHASKPEERGADNGSGAQKTGPGHASKQEASEGVEQLERLYQDALQRLSATQAELLKLRIAGASKQEAADGQIDMAGLPFKAALEVWAYCADVAKLDRDTALRSAIENYLIRQQLLHPAAKPQDGNALAHWLLSPEQAQSLLDLDNKDDLVLHSSDLQQHASKQEAVDEKSLRADIFAVIALSDYPMLC